MNTTLTRHRVSKAIKDKLIIVVKHTRHDEVLPVETRMIPLDIVEEICGIAKHQAFLIGFKVELIPVLLSESDFCKLMLESISEIRLTSKTFNPKEPTKLYRMMKRTPTVAWMVRREW